MSPKTDSFYTFYIILIEIVEFENYNEKNELIVQTRKVIQTLTDNADFY